MNKFEQALLEDWQPPLHEAASFFAGIKKFAEATDPPDETGVLEGQFPAPVEQVIQLMGELVRNEFETIYAYSAYAQSLRDLAHGSLAEHFEEHEEDEEEHAAFLMKRMAVLGGPLNLQDIKAPPPSTNPVSIIQTLIRMEQEGIEGWRRLLDLIGDDNPMHITVEDYMAKEQEHLDDLWQLLPDEYKTGPAPGGAETGMDPGMAGEEEELPSEEGMEEEELPQAGEAEPKEVLASMRLSALLLKTAADKSDADLKKTATAMRFQLALMKLAQGEMDGASAEEAGMSSPTAGELEPINYLNAELAGRQAQEANESSYYREQLGQAKQEATSAQQQAQQAQMMLEQLQQQAEQAGAQVQAAAQQAVQAQDAATQQTLEAAKARIGAQEMRAKMLELVSQDPSVFGESAMGPAPGMAPPQPGAPGAPGTEPAPGAEGAPPEGGGAPAPDASMMGEPAPEGPAGSAPTPPAPPGGVPAAEGGVGPGGPTAPVGAPPGPNPDMAAPAGQMKTGSALSERLIGAGAGAVLGAGGSLYAGHKAPELAAKAQQMNADKGDSFWAAARAAAAQNKATGAQLAAEHPVGSAIVGGLGGAMSGAMAGPSIMREGRALKQNISDIAGR